MAAREKTGVYLDKENYDKMLESMEENESRIGELESQLAAQLHHVQILVRLSSHCRGTNHR